MTMKEEHDVWAKGQDGWKSPFHKLLFDIAQKGINLKIPVWGYCMSPFIRHGDVVIIKPMNEAEVSIGDIVVFLYRHRMFVHRLISKYQKKGKTVLLTKGDSFPHFDQPISPEDVLGKVVAIDRGKRKINLDNAFGRITNLFLAKISPFSPWIYPVLRKTKHGVLKVLGKVWLTGLFR